LPFAEKRGFVLVATTFELADGSVYPGYCQAIPDNSNVPPAFRTTQGDTGMTPQSGSAMDGGTGLSAMDFPTPTIFVDAHWLDFCLGPPTRRRKIAVRSFYAAIGKKPREVFPLRFAADTKLAAGITSGKLDGFFYLPLGGATFEIDTDESFLDDDGTATAPLQESGGECDAGLTAIVATARETGTNASETPAPELRDEADLRLADFERRPVWVRVHGLDEGEPWYGLADRFTVRPWTGPTPVAPEKMWALIGATFVLRDGTKYPGYVRAIPENWADIIPPPTNLGQGMAPKVLFRGSPLAIVAEQRPCIFVGGLRIGFWCAFRNSDETRLAFYNAVGKASEQVFPIRFQGAPGLADGIVEGEIDGFCRLVGLRLKIER
jgi:hypothetical protein